MKRFFAMGRFALGSTLGIGGLGLMGQTVFPLRLAPFIIGVGLLCVGLFLALGTLSAVRRRH